MSRLESLGIQSGEVVSFVGAGGKSTLVLACGREAAAAGWSVVMTTTTKMGTDQIPHDAVVVTGGDPSPEPGTMVFLAASIDGEKVVGVVPEGVDRIAGADLIAIEADGARRRRFKAPAAHEPVIPASTTLFAVVAGVAAVGRPIAECHRPERIAALVGRDAAEPLRSEDMARVMTDPAGSLKGCPPGVRTAAVLRGGDPVVAEEVAAGLRASGRYERVVIEPGGIG
jgi:probable selenium-dependent hydroxylase accessory protein YqeC